MNDPAMDPQRIAAMLDGRLDAADRQRLIEELAASDDALGAYADAAAVLRELERDGVIEPRATDAESAATAPAPPFAARAQRPTTVTPLAGAPGRKRTTSRGRIVRWAALAAGIVVMIAAPVLWQRSRSDARIPAEPGGVVSYVAFLAADARAAGLPPGWDGTPWGSTRGAGDPLTPEERGVRIGARLTDLELAAASGDSASARAIAREVAALLEEVPGAGAAGSTYRAFAASAADRQALARARRDAALVAGEDDVALGLWLETARVAAARRDTAYFRAPGSRAARARGSRAVQALAPASMARLDSALADPRGAAWADAERELTALLATLGG